MKTAVIFFRSPNMYFDGEFYGNAISVLLSGGITVDRVEIVNSSDEGEFVRRLEDIRNVFDNLIILDGEKCTFDLKEMICDRMETVLEENENAKSLVKAASIAMGVPCEEKYANLPSDSTIIPNHKGVYQGYLMDAEDFTLAVIPENYVEFKSAAEEYLLPYLKNKFQLDGTVLTLKYFGNVKRAEQALKNAAEKFNGIEYTVCSKHGDVTINIAFDKSVSADDKITFNREVLSELKDDVYAEFSTTLAERLLDVLKLKKLKLAIAESFTGGGVTNSIVKLSGASEFLTEGLVTYANESKIKRLGVEEKAIFTQGAVSSTVAYQMAAGLLKSGRCDVAIATTGIAGPNLDGTDKPVGLGYIAVGMKDGVHTYRYNFSGSREEIMETAKNTALFLAIKKLKNV